MKVLKTVTREIEVATDIVCNKCGESCVPLSVRNSTGTPVKYVDGAFQQISKEESLELYGGPEAYGLIEVTVSGGYGSTHLKDGCKYTFSLCESCLKDIFDSCKEYPVVTNYL